ncbi:MAG: hypothetical protein ACLP1X_18610 [Polyangiaceae bacterium]
MNSCTRRGRPPSADPKLADVHVRLTPEQYERALRISATTGESVSSVLRRAVDGVQRGAVR